MMGFLPDGWLPRRSPADPDIASGDASPQPPERPADANPTTGRYEPPRDPQDAISVAAGLRAQAVLDAVAADPGAANRRPDFPEPPDYSRRGRGAVARIDAVLDENLRAVNQRLRADLRDEIDRRRTVELERDTALARIAELELTLKALGRFVVHAAGHDPEGGE